MINECLSIHPRVYMKKFVLYWKTLIRLGIVGMLLAYFWFKKNKSFSFETEESANVLYEVAYDQPMYVGFHNASSCLQF